MSKEIRKSICGICTSRCIMNIEVEDGVMKSVKPCREPGFEGCNKPCIRGVKGLAYEYRKDRILKPLRAVGHKGSGEFEEITWDQAINEISEKLLNIREKYGADSISFFSGYSKWYRPMLRRLCTSFGSVNYGTESSSCHRSTAIASMCDSGYFAVPDYKNAKAILAFARARLPKPLTDAVEKGTKLVVIDSRLSKDIEKYADLHLRPLPGTDIAVVHAIARWLIINEKIDKNYIGKYVHGFEAYKEMVMEFTPEKAQELSGVPAEQIIAAAKMIGENLPFSSFNGFTGIIHHRNGCNTYRAYEALQAITGCYGRKGGNIPTAPIEADGEPASSYRMFQFSHPYEPDRKKLIGGRRFPLWKKLLDECQAMDYCEAFERGELKAVFALGMNARMFPDSQSMFEMLKKLDFFVCCDLWMSDTAKCADIILPICTSYERNQVALTAMNKKLWYSYSAIEPLGEARSDEEIMIDLARAMDLDDELLKAGQDACDSWQLEGTGISLEELKGGALPFAKLPACPKPDIEKDGFITPTGKYELYSMTVEGMPGLDSLPVFKDPLLGQDKEEYPFILMAGVRTDRYQYAIHSRTHTVPEFRALHDRVTADLNPMDLERLGLKPGDQVKVTTMKGSLVVEADEDTDLLPGTINIYHGCAEADVNTLIPDDYLDPYTGFPGYKAIACKLEKI